MYDHSLVQILGCASAQRLLHQTQGRETTRKHRSELEKKEGIQFKHMGTVIALNFSIYAS